MSKLYGVFEGYDWFNTCEDCDDDCGNAVCFKGVYDSLEKAEDAVYKLAEPHAITWEERDSLPDNLIKRSIPYRYKEQAGEYGFEGRRAYSIAEIALNESYEDIIDTIQMGVY